MILPSIKIERELLRNGADLIIGVDEAGRGPLAGPVVAAAAWVNPEILERKFENRELIRDSKTLSEKQRTSIFANIEARGDFVFGIGEVSEGMIDQLNILQATYLAMRIAVEELVSKLIANNEKGEIINKNSKQGYSKNYVLIDGNRHIPKVYFEQKLFPKGDRDIFSIAVASICAKVHRDRLMLKYHQEFPQYGFDSHKGYGTRYHLEQIKKHGLCRIHRKSFGPCHVTKNL